MKRSQSSIPVCSPREKKGLGLFQHKAGLVEWQDLFLHFWLINLCSFRCDCQWGVMLPVILLAKAICICMALDRVILGMWVKYTPLSPIFLLANEKAPHNLWGSTVYLAETLRHIAGCAGISYFKKSCHRSRRTFLFLPPNMWLAPLIHGGHFAIPLIVLQTSCCGGNYPSSKNSKSVYKLKSLESSDLPVWPIPCRRKGSQENQWRMGIVVGLLWMRTWYVKLQYVQALSIRSTLNQPEIVVAVAAVR